MKHHKHISHITSIPISYWMIEICRSVKHSLHGSYLAGIPISYWLIKFCCSVKHITHISRTLSIPVTQILIKCHLTITIIKHTLKICHLRDIPIRDISSIKLPSTQKHLIHSSYTTRIIKLHIFYLRLIKHSFHILNLSSFF